MFYLIINNIQSSSAMGTPTGPKRRASEEAIHRSPRRRKIDDMVSISLSVRSPDHEAGHSSSECSSGIHPSSTVLSESTLRAHSDPPFPQRDCDVGDDGNRDPITKVSDEVACLTREAWEIRQKMIALRDREAAIRREFCRLNGLPEVAPPYPNNNNNTPGTSHCTQIYVDSFTFQDQVLESRLFQMEAELREERERRIRAERVLEDVERECRSPFVVPALFRAFITISELPT
ncbi:hypothetical protein J3A83DRAFT_979916 [Scleroderma citrinum]